MNHVGDELLAAFVDGQMRGHEPDKDARDHLATCPECNSARDRMSVAAHALESLPSSLAPMDVAALVRKLDDRPRNNSAAFFRLAFAAGFAAVIALTASHLAPIDKHDAMTPRGVRGEHNFELAVFAESSAGRRELASNDRIGSSTRFGFEVKKPPMADAYLMVFAVDQAGDVHWFYPAVASSLDDPTSIALDSASTRLTLPDIVQPEGVTPGAFTVHALLSEKPYRVSAIETAIAHKKLSDLVRTRAAALTLAFDR